MKKSIPIFLSLIFFVVFFGGNAWAVHPCIKIVKEVSVDGGITWHNADSPDFAPETATGQRVEYRLTVTNCSTYYDLRNVTGLQNKRQC